ncbi:hypothetical protein [Alishewanella longhuensis]
MNRINKALSLLAGAMLLAGCASKAPETVAPTFGELATQIWQAETALKTPAPGSLTDMSMAALAERQQQRLLLQQRLLAVDLAKLSEQEQIDHAILAYRLADEIDQYRFGAHFTPLTSESGFHTF